MHIDAPTDPASMMEYGERFCRMEVEVTNRLAGIREASWKSWRLLHGVIYCVFRMRSLLYTCDSCASSFMPGHGLLDLRCVSGVELNKRACHGMTA